MRFASLGSGSEGNSLLISTGADTRACHVMLDCGFGLKEAERRLKEEEAKVEAERTAARHLPPSVRRKKYIPDHPIVIVFKPR